MMRLLSLLLFFLLTACATGPDYTGPPKLENAASDKFARETIAPVTSAEPIANWWSQLNDAILTDIVSKAFVHNRDLIAAQANLRASRAILRENRQGYLPTGGVSGSYQRQGVSEELFSTQQAGVPIADTDFFEAGFDAAWELDIFGRISRSVEADRAEAGANEAARDDLMVSIAAEVASSYVQLRGSQKRLAVATRNARNQENSFQLTETLLRGGRGTRLDVERARAQLETTLASIPPLEAQIDVSIHRLGILTGDGPTGLESVLRPEGAFPQIPEILAVGDPSGLLRRRPDIRRAERELAAATARIGIETADLFPTVSIVGSGGLQSNDIGNLVQGSAFAFSLGPQLVWNLLDWGRIRARIAQADARADASAARYEQTVLLALEETENALSRYGNELRRGRRLDKATVSAKEAARLARLRFRYGVDDFLEVLDSERVTLENEDRLVVSEIETATQLIAIYKALGGGWQNGGTEVSNNADPLFNDGQQDDENR